MSLEILNPEFEVGPLTPKLFKYREFGQVNYFLSNLDIFPPEYFKFVVEPKCLI